MSGVISSKGYIGIGKQSAKGTGVAPDFYIKFKEDSGSQEFETTPHREGCDDELIGEVIKNKHVEKFGFNFLGRVEQLAYMLAYILGADTVTGSSPYIHTLTRLAGGRPWLSVERKLSSGLTLRQIDSKISKIVIEAEAGKSVMVSIEGNSLSSDNSVSPGTCATETSPALVFYHGKGRYEVDDTVTADIKKFMIEIIVNDSLEQGDDVTLQDINDLSLDINVSFDLWTRDLNLYKKINYNNQSTPQSDLYFSGIEIDLQTTDQAANDNQLKITIPKVVYQPVTGIVLKADPEVMTQTIAGIAVKPAAGEIITAVVKNYLSADLI